LKESTHSIAGTYCEPVGTARATQSAAKSFKLYCLSKEAGALEDGEPLSLHGARRTARAWGDSVSTEPVAAQEQLRHKSIETTKESYSHIEASKQADVVSELLDRRS
jgi:integrase